MYLSNFLKGPIPSILVVTFGNAFAYFVVFCLPARWLVNYIIQLYSKFILFNINSILIARSELTLDP